MVELSLYKFRWGFGCFSRWEGLSCCLVLFLLMILWLAGGFICCFSLWGCGIRRSIISLDVCGSVNFVNILILVGDIPFHGEVGCFPNLLYGDYGVGAR